LQQAQKMEAVGQLTGGIAHDFNNLLGVVIGNLDLLHEMIAKDREPADLANEALKAALRGAELSQRLLAFSRRQSLQPALLDPHKVLSGMRTLLERAVGERVTLEMPSSKDTWPIKADPAQLESALLNLAVNARDAMPEGGRLIVEAADVTVDEDFTLTHPGVRTGEYVCISVSDTGQGMSRDVQARAFEPFFTTKPTGKGSGLGLSMVFGFIKQSEGHVTIYSEPGHGTIVRLYLPRVHSRVAAAEQRTAKQEDTAPHPTGNETVLVVEDNEPMAQVATRQLRELGYNVIAATGATEALSALDSGAHIDLMFTDVVMPGPMDGIALTHKARLLRPSLKVLLTSGFTQRGSAATTGESLPARLLPKPYRKHHLATVVRQTLDE
jgi:CheY-like chemotaxis protein